MTSTLRPHPTAELAAIAGTHADCPECQAAIARGEQPILMTAAEIMNALTRPQRRRLGRELARAQRRAARVAARAGAGR